MLFFFNFSGLTTYVSNGGFVKTCARYSTEMYRQDELSSVLVEGNEGERCQVLRRSICQVMSGPWNLAYPAGVYP